jgi:hypothetical protein
MIAYLLSDSDRVGAPVLASSPSFIRPLSSQQDLFPVTPLAACRALCSGG